MLWFFFLLILSHASTAHAPCLTDEIKAKYTPSDRGILQPIRFPALNWPSARLSYYVAYYLLSETMGYNIYVIDELGGSVAAWNNLGENAIDLSVEMWDAFADLRLQYSVTENKVRDFGPMGYSGHSGIYVPDFALEVNPYYEYIVSLNSTEAQVYFNVSITDYIESNPTLKSKLIADGYGTPSTPDEVFEPAWCVNNQCIELFLAYSSWYVNHYQSVIVNNKYMMKITWWDYDRMVSIADSLINDNIPFIFAHEIPDGFIADSPLTRITIKTPTDSCFAGADTSNVEGISSVDCDFGPTRLFKAGTIEYFDQEAAADGQSFLAMLTLSETSIGPMLGSVYNGTSERDAACNWLNSNENVWSPWIVNTYIAPVEEDKLSATTIIGYIAVGGLCLLAMVWLLYYFGILHWIESALFTMFLMYLGKFVCDSCDFMSDMFVFLTEINGNSDADVLYIPYALCLGTSAISYGLCSYWNIKNAVIAFKTKEGSRESAMRQSVLHGHLHKFDDFNNAEDAMLWTKAEIEFSTNRIIDCYGELLVVLFEDLPMIAMNTYLIISLEVYNLWVFISFAISCVAVGARLSEFFKIVQYKRQFEWADKQVETHDSLKSLQKKVAKAKKSLFIKSGKKTSLFPLRATFFGKYKVKAAPQPLEA